MAELPAKKGAARPPVAVSYTHLYGGGRSARPRRVVSLALDGAGSHTLDDVLLAEDYIQAGFFEIECFLDAKQHIFNLLRLFLEHTKLQET